MLCTPSSTPWPSAWVPVQIHWYGLTYLVAFGLFLWLAALRAKSPGLPRPAGRVRDVEDLLFYGVLGVVHRRAHRLRRCSTSPALPGHPLEILMVWKGGMSFHGGLLGVIGAHGLVRTQRGRPFLEVMDLVAPCVPTGPGLGRVGNFINGELWGRAADPSLPWAMVFPQSGSAIAAPPVAAVPVGAGGPAAVRAAVVVRAAAARTRPGGGGVRRGLWRVPLRRRILPRARQLPGLLALGMSMGQWLCVPMIAGRRRAVGLGGTQRTDDMMRQIFFDTETTGLEAENGDRIIEIGCLEMVDRR
jgi:phosphatidylglycerol:prolipoprotein diacylglycerol transferase